MGKGEIDRIDTGRIVARVGASVELPDSVRCLGSELGFDAADECFEQIEDERVAGAELLGHCRLDQGRDDNRTCAVDLLRLLDLVQAILQHVHRGDERHADLTEIDALKLAQQAVTKRLCGNACAIRDKKDTAR